MDTYYTVEEKYLQAVDEFSWGEAPKALHILNEIIQHEPFYARAHFLLGKIHYYTIKDYQTAGYHFKTCMELEPLFPDIYFHYLQLVVFLNMEKLVYGTFNKAKAVPGVNQAALYNFLGLFLEKNKHWKKATKAYEAALAEVLRKDEKENIEESIQRVAAKMKKGKKYQYELIANE
jgi:Tfp pilus assembly protein PilF